MEKWNLNPEDLPKDGEQVLTITINAQCELHYKIAKYGERGWTRRTEACLRAKHTI